MCDNGNNTLSVLRSSNFMALFFVSFARFVKANHAPTDGPDGARANVGCGFPKHDFPDIYQMWNKAAGVPEHRIAENYFHMMAGADIGPGEEIFVDYRGDSTIGGIDDFLTTYGFIPDHMIKAQGEEVVDAEEFVDVETEAK